MERGSRIFMPCLSTNAGSRPLEPCRMSTSTASPAVERNCAASSRKRTGAVTRHSHMSKEAKLLQ